MNPFERRAVPGAALALGLLLPLGGCQRFEPRPAAPERTAAALEKRSLGDPELARWVAQHREPARTPWPPAQWDYESLRWVARRYHPALALAWAQWEVAESAIRTAGARPNPTLGVAPGYNFDAARGVSPWLPALTVDLPIETAGKRGYRLARGRALAEAARQDALTAIRQVSADLRRAYLEAAFAEARAGLLEEQLKTQTGVLELLEQRQQAGAVSGIEVSAARLALVKGRAEAGDARQQVPVARSRLAAALGLPAGALEGQRLAAPPEAAPAPSIEAIETARRQTLQRRPEVLAALSRYEARQAALQLELARQYPDLHLGSPYQWDQGENKWSLSVTLELPLLNRNQGPIGEAEARRREAAAQVLAAQAAVLAQVDAAFASLRAAREREAQLRPVHAELERGLGRLRARLEAGDADRLEWEEACLARGASAAALLQARAATALAAGELEDALDAP
jgi:outer membrane protein TolC